MNDQEKMEVIFQNLNDAVKSHRARNSSSSSRDCLGACDAAYNACNANAGSDLEKAVCNSAYTKCVANC